MTNKNDYEKEYQDMINCLKEKYSDFKSDYPTFWKTNAYDMYDLYVELPQSHPYFTQEFSYIKSDFDIGDSEKFSKHNSTRAKCQFCKFYWYSGAPLEAIEFMDLFASSLKKIELEFELEQKLDLDTDILHKSKKAKYN